MKTLKRITGLLAVVLFVSVQAFSQSAATAEAKKNNQEKQVSSTPMSGTNADNAKAGACCNQQGKMKNGKCTTFTDKNGDGVCDNCKSACKGKGNSKGCEMSCKEGKGNGHGNCAGAGCGSKSKNCCAGQSKASTQPTTSPEKK